MKHFLNTQDWSRAELDALLAEAARMKQHKLGDALRGRSIALLRSYSYSAYGYNAEQSVQDAGYMAFCV